MKLDDRDEESLTHFAARSAMVMIAHELSLLLDNPGVPSFCSAATLNLIDSCTKERGDVREDGRTPRATVVFARRAALLAAALSRPKNVEIGPERCDA